LHGRGDRVRMTFDRILSGKGHRDILDDGRREIASKREWGCSMVTAGRETLCAVAYVASAREALRIRRRDASGTAGRMPALLCGGFHAMLRKTFAFEI
jgi:hypothetical protein